MLGSEKRVFPASKLGNKAPALRRAATKQLLLRNRSAACIAHTESSTNHETFVFEKESGTL